MVTVRMSPTQRQRLKQAVLDANLGKPRGEKVSLSKILLCRGIEWAEWVSAVTDNRQPTKFPNYLDELLAEIARLKGLLPAAKAALRAATLLEHERAVEVLWDAVQKADPDYMITKKEWLAGSDFKPEGGTAVE